ncbi:hypothetical protein UC8_58160 [Roseimaritima ulvae]|uniref:Uncharacterized protein n=1 Tax=Roseimaritima ulvae TaxID=980254 RepID=A0A5B9R9R0_9BACT|nr:hypothetical protein UC8_58160 [Roseimaritima ulvae]
MQDSENGGRRYLWPRQFSLRILLLAMLFLGPICGWLGPPIIAFVYDAIVADDVEATPKFRTHGGTI